MKMIKVFSHLKIPHLMMKTSGLVALLQMIHRVAIVTKYICIVSELIVHCRGWTQFKRGSYNRGKNCDWTSDEDSAKS